MFLISNCLQYASHDRACTLLTCSLLGYKSQRGNIVLIKYPRIIQLDLSMFWEYYDLKFL